MGLFNSKTKPSENDLRLHRCSFTGHRPEKLNRPEAEIKKDLKEAIEKAVAEGYTTFLTGMARGVDLWAAEIVLALKTRNKNIRLICAIPYDGFEARWSPQWKSLYQRILDKADSIYDIADRYSPSVFQARNEFMVDHSSKLIAVYNGSSGGTWNTIQYAQRNELSITYIEG